MTAPSIDPWVLVIFYRLYLRARQLHWAQIESGVFSPQGGGDSRGLFQQQESSWR